MILERDCGPRYTTRSVIGAGNLMWLRRSQSTADAAGILGRRSHLTQTAHTSVYFRCDGESRRW